jgi:hypothetical protein
MRLTMVFWIAGEGRRHFASVGEFRDPAIPMQRNVFEKLQRDLVGDGRYGVEGGVYIDMAPRIARLRNQWGDVTIMQTSSGMPRSVECTDNLCRPTREPS